MNISRSIKMALVDSNLKDVDHAAMSGISRSYFSKMKNGHKLPCFKHLAPISKSFNMKVSEFIALGES